MPFAHVLNAQAGPDGSLRVDIVAGDTVISAELFLENVHYNSGGYDTVARMSLQCLVSDVKHIRRADFDQAQEARS